MPKKRCKICGLTATDELNYGPWKSAGNCTIHYFCALLSTDSKQNGADDEGIDGFLVDDIDYLARAYAKTKCCYCKKPRATVRCCAPNCKRIFHVVCGIKRNCLYQYVDQFDSYCHLHVKIEEKYDIHGIDWHCQICGDEMGEYHALTSVPSCCNQGYYHKRCMQQYTITAGTYAHCPSCGYDPDGYRKFLSLRGIFCPEKDADWLQTKDPYGPVPQQPAQKRCSADVCRCPNGRDHVNEQGEWQLNHCKHCSYFGVHAECRDDDPADKFGCKRCNGMISTVKRKRKREIETTMLQDRLDLFFSKSDLDVKPRPPPWLI